jgi:hypothetical protein
MVYQPFGRGTQKFASVADSQKQMKKWLAGRKMTRENFLAWMAHCGCSKEAIQNHRMRKEHRARGRGTTRAPRRTRRL